MSKSIADQSEAALGGPASVLVRQRRDHVRLNELLDEVRKTAGEEQDEALTRLCRLVFPHAFAEEAVLWPAIRKAVPEAEEMTLEVEQEHQEINELMAAVERSRHTDPDRKELLERAFTLLDHDVREEEDDLLPQLQAALSHRELQRLGVTWEIVRRTAPTRSHPTVARRPPGNVLSALPLSAIDRSRDLLDRAARATPKPVAESARFSSGALAKLSGAVERLPPMRMGEDPSTKPGRTEIE